MSKVNCRNHSQCNEPGDVSEGCYWPIEPSVRGNQLIHGVLHTNHDETEWTCDGMNDDGVHWPRASQPDHRKVEELAQMTAGHEK